MSSGLEAWMERDLRIIGAPEWVREYRFAPPRRWRFDFAWPDLKVAVEIEGGIHIRGRGSHTSVARYTADCEKYNAATMAGWRVLRFTSAMLRDGTAAETMLWVKLQAA